MWETPRDETTPYTAQRVIFPNRLIEPINPSAFCVMPPGSLHHRVLRDILRAAGCRPQSFR